MTPRRALPAALLLLAACAVPPPPSPVTLPDSALPEGLGDPTRAAILGSAFAFAQPASIAGDAAAGATALGQVEFLAVELTGPRWIGFDPLVVPMLSEARAELRAALGFAPLLPPQGAIDALFGAAAALRRADREAALRALSPLAPGAEATTLARLAALPPLPRTAQATARANRALMQRDRGNGRRPLF